MGDIKVNEPRPAVLRFNLGYSFDFADPSSALQRYSKGSSLAYTWSPHGNNLVTCLPDGIGFRRRGST